MFFASVRPFSPFPFSHRTYYNLKFTNHSKGLYTHREFLHKTRMHSSRMRTARSSCRHGGISTHPPWSSPPGAGTPLGAGTPQPDPPQLLPWVWTWTTSPSISPLAVGLDQTPLNFPLGCGSGNLQGMLGYHPLETCCKACWDTTCNACWDSNPQL